MEYSELTFKLQLILVATIKMISLCLELLITIGLLNFKLLGELKIIRLLSIDADLRNVICFENYYTLNYFQ